MDSNLLRLIGGSLTFFSLAIGFFVFFTPAVGSFLSLIKLAVIGFLFIVGVTVFLVGNNLMRKRLG